MGIASEIFEGLRNVLRDIHNITSSIHQGQYQMRQEVQILVTAVAAIQAQLAISNSKEDQLIALALANGASQDDVDAITKATTDINAVTAGMAAEAIKVDAALTPAPIPAAPAPTSNTDQGDSSVNTGVNGDGVSPGTSTNGPAETQPQG